MRSIGGLAGALGAMAAGILAPSAAAAPLVFDCDTPSGNSSSVSSPAGPGVRIATTVRAVALRPGKTLPVAGLVLTSADGTNALGFQLSLPSPDAIALQLILTGRTNGQPVRQVVRDIPLSGSVAFAMQLDAAGKGQLMLGEQTIALTFANLGVGRATAFCGAGQFRFENLEIAAL
jgi:hypothetical protein